MMLRGLPPLLLLAACAQDDPSWTVIRGDPVVLHHDPDLPVCAGTVPFLDVSARAIASFAEQPLPRSIPYYYARDVAGPCRNPKAEACTQRDPLAIWAKFPAITHELVHAIQAGYFPSLLMEGEAVALGGTLVFSSPRPDLSDDELLGHRELPGELYGTAGDLVSYLITRWGIGAFQSLVGGLAYESTPAQIQDAFTRVYGKSFSEARQERARSGLVFPDNRLWIPECKGVPVEDSGSLSEPLSCATDAVGPTNGFMSRLRSFEVKTTGLHAVVPHGPPDGFISLFLCGGSLPTTVYYGKGGQLADDARVVGHLSAGRYLLNFLAPFSDRVSDFSTAIEPLPVAPIAGCPDSVPHVSIDAATHWLTLFSTEAPDSFEVSFRVERERTAAGMARTNFASSGAIVCTPACSASCMEASWLTVMTLSPDATYSLRGRFDGTGQPATLRFF
jgi:hypothetical protein